MSRDHGVCPWVCPVACHVWRTRMIRTKPDTTPNADSSGQALTLPGRPGEDLTITGAERPAVILSPALSLAA